MRKYRKLLRLLLALLACDLGVRAFANTWEAHSPDDYAMKLAGCANAPRSFVVVGGSPVSEGIDPDVLGPNGYAMGLPGGTTSEFYHAVLHGCRVPPKRLIYGITASDLNDSRHEPHGPASLMTAGDAFTWAVERPDSREWVLRQFALARLQRLSGIYRHRHGVRMWASLGADSCFPGACEESVREAKELHAYADTLRTGTGYAPAAGFANQRYDLVKQAGAKLAPFAFLDRYRTGSHRQYLAKLIDWAKANGVDLWLVDMPVTADLEAQYPEAFSEYRGLLAETGRSCRVLRAHRDAVGLTDAGFADTIHLNCVGAQVLSRWLRDRLAEDGR